jgi:hypothetical protein
MKGHFRAAKLVVSIVVVGFFGVLGTGCNWEVSDVPLPRPSPTPTPSPTPVIEFSEAASAPTPTRVTLTEQIALANADLVTSASAAAVEQATKFESTARKAAAAPASAAGDLSGAIDSLAKAKRSYQKTEAAVFYVDPSSVEELSAQPDPLGAGVEDYTVDAFAETERRLKKLARLSVGEMNEKKLQEILTALPELAGWSGRLRADMQAIAEAWAPGSAANFRERYFLASPEAAVARIFQGLLAQSGDVLPRRWLQGAVIADEVTGRTDALRDLYLGISEENRDGKGLHDLVFAAAPAQAMATYGAIAQAAALADALALAPTNEETRRQLLVALENVTRQLELSAAAVGIKVVYVAE